MRTPKKIMPFNGLAKETYIELTKPARVNYVLQDDGQTAVIDIDGYIGRDMLREWMTGEKSENTVKNIKDSLREIRAQKIIVNINSPGGDLNDGLVIMDMLKAKNAEIVTNVYGFSASAATVIAQAGSTRRISENAFVLYHRVMFGICGFFNQNTFYELIEDADVIDNVLIGLFVNNSSISREKLLELMDGGGGYGKWVNAEDALKYGLVDEVFEPSDDQDDNLDRMNPDDRTRNMKNIEALTASQLMPNSKNGKEKDHKQQEHSDAGASARIRTIETLKRKVQR